jgi:hypothetical protein
MGSVVVLREEVGARCRNKVWTADPDKQPATPVDVARLPDILENCREESRHCWRDIPRSARHGGDAAGEGR